MKKHKKQKARKRYENEVKEVLERKEGQQE